MTDRLALFRREAPTGVHRMAAMVVSGLSALNAIGGGVGLIMNGLGIPESEPEGTPFGTFLVPGILLAVVVGGSMAIACWLAWQRHSLAAAAMLVAGGTMLGWITVESVMISSGRVLQAVVASLALLATTLGARALRGRAHLAPAG